MDKGYISKIIHFLWFFKEGIKRKTKLKLDKGNIISEKNNWDNTISWVNISEKYRQGLG